jgi:hypothetical protein
LRFFVGGVLDLAIDALLATADIDLTALLGLELPCCGECGFEFAPDE